MKAVKIKRRLHQSDIRSIKDVIDSVEEAYKNLIDCLNENDLDHQRINESLFLINHATPEIIKRTQRAIDSIGKEIE